MKDAGYQYVTSDDLLAGQPRCKGNIVADPQRFPMA